MRTAILVLLTGMLVLLSGNLAYAYFTSAGLGAGPGRTGTAASVALGPGTLTATLYPGGTGTVSTRATNANPGPVRITSLALDTTQGTGGFAVDAAHSACTLTTFGFTTQTNGGTGWTVPGGGSLTITLPGALTATAATANACQGATLTTYLRAGT